MTDQTTSNPSRNIQDDPVVQRLFERMPKSVQKSFSDEQLMHLRNAIGARSWGDHSIDCRGVFSLPMSRWRFYYVFLVGRNRRKLSDSEKLVSLWFGAIFTLGIIASCILVILIALYLLKSAAGIDLFPGFSLGIWDWFKNQM